MTQNTIWLGIYALVFFVYSDYSYSYGRMGLSDVDLWGVHDEEGIFEFVNAC